MKLYIWLSLIAAAALAGLSSCSHDKNELEHHHDHEGTHSHEGHHDHEGLDPHHDVDEHDEHAHGVIVLDTATAARFGVHASPARRQPFGGVVKASGALTLSASATSVVTAPAAGTITLAPGIAVGSEVHAGQAVASVKAGTVSGSTANDIARAELEAARAELDRVTPLYEQRLVTRARYNEVRAAYERALAAYSAPAASGRAVAAAPGMITSIEAPTGSYVEAGSPVATVASGSALTLRADVPVRYSHAAASASDARIIVPATGATFTVSELGGRRLNASAATAGATAGYIPVVFSLPAAAGLVPGSAVEVYLSDGNDTAEAITVPRSALYEQQGDFCVFIRLDEDCYRKVPVTVGRDNGVDVAILSGINEGDMVVDRGVTTVRLAGASGAVPAGHSHSH